MVIKIPQELKNELKTSNNKALVETLQFMDQRLIAMLKGNKEDLRFYQGYSAAVDKILDLITNQ